MKTMMFVLVTMLAFSCTREIGDTHHPGEMDLSGEHGGRLFEAEGGVSLELLIYEAVGEPEFRAWVRQADVPVTPEAVGLTVTLKRLGGAQDVLGFRPVADVLVSDAPVREPHSFGVIVELVYDGRTHRWEYESLEGRTRIPAEMAEKFGLAVAQAGPAVISEAVEVFGTVAADPSRTWAVQARFPGTIRSVAVQAGDRVTSGAELALVESDESLKSYPVVAPASGVIVERLANVGEQTAGRTLFRMVDPTQVWAMFRVFASDRSKIRVGQAVTVFGAAGDRLGQGVIDWIALTAGQDQSVQVRVALANHEGLLLPGMHLTGSVAVASHEVDLAVRRSALQSFRDFTVVYRQVGDLYEVRMLSLGRRDDEWAEVLDGLDVGDVYVTENSYLVKADIDKDSATHDH